MAEGWIKLHRKIFDNPVVTKDPEHFIVWVWLLVHASHKPHQTMFNGEKITLEAGQLITGRKKISAETHVSESKVQRILKSFKIEQQIEQQTNRHGSLISIVRWDEYQKSEQQNEQLLNNHRTTTEQPVNTIQECKEYKNENNDSSLLTNDESANDPIWKMAPQYRDNLRAMRERIRKVNNTRRATYE